eukprot:COSAG06_NODE_40839_length_398_cov_0.535117_1_plen_33_part_01
MERLRSFAPMKVGRSGTAVPERPTFIGAKERNR